MIFKIIIYILFFFISINSSFAKSNSDLSSYFLEIRHSEAISKTNNYDDHDSTESKKIATSNGSGMEGTNSFGIGFGKQWNDDYNILLSIEKINSENDLGTIILKNGTQYNQSKFKYRTKSIIFEIERGFKFKDNLNFFVNIGLGYSKFNFNENALYLNTSSILYKVGQKNNNTDFSTRLGGGLSYSLSKNMEFITSIDYTDLGEAEWKESDGDITAFHIKSTNAVIKLRYFF